MFKKTALLILTAGCGLSLYAAINQTHAQQLFVSPNKTSSNGTFATVPTNNNSYKLNSAQEAAGKAKLLSTAIKEVDKLYDAVLCPHFDDLHGENIYKCEGEVEPPPPPPPVIIEEPPEPPPPPPPPEPQGRCEKTRINSRTKDKDINAYLEQGYSFHCAINSSRTMGTFRALVTEKFACIGETEMKYSLASCNGRENIGQGYMWTGSGYGTVTRIYQ